MAVEFEAPDFVQNNSPEEIHERMMNMLPADLDNMPGGFPYDLTMPAAVEKSMLVEFQITRALQLMFPEWAIGEFLDLHAKCAGLVRKEAGKASGYVTITGASGTIIPKSTVVCTEATADTPSVNFSTDEQAIIPDTGSINVPVTAMAAGTASNVAAGTILFMLSGIKGVETLTNPKAVSGGTDRESDDALRERIDSANAQAGESFVANDTDYVRWARDVTGVGDCIVIPTWNGPGTVKLVIIDENGEPANDSIVKAVYDHIVSPDDRSRRLLPTGSAQLTVVAATNVSVSYTCTGLKYDDTTNIDQIVSAFKIMAKGEYAEAKSTGRNVLYYNQMRGHITEIPGVIDFGDFKMNGKTENISLSQEEYAITKSVDFS